MSATLLDVPIHGIAAGGAGVGRLADGRAVFVHRTAPGDQARVAITAERRQWARGRLASVSTPGPDRRSPPCPYYARCGGCTLQHLEYPAQLAWKRRIVEDALSRIGGVEHGVDAVTASSRELMYRSRMSFTLKRLRNGRVVAGLHELEAPARVFDLAAECLLADPELTTVWHRLRETWGPGAGRLPAGGELRLTLRQADQGVVLVIRGGRGSGDPRVLLDAVDDLVAIWQEREGGPPVLLAGDGDTTETWLGEPLAVRASGFVQVNREAGESLHRRVLELASASVGKVVDAYAGAGVLGRALARAGWQACGLESEEEAVAAARADAPPGFQLVAGKVEERMAECLPADMVVLNPPRSGVAAEVCDVLLATPPEAVLYVSCDPATLARDLHRLDGGFDVVRVELFDLFPQTAHVETLALLRRREPG